MIDWKKIWLSAALDIRGLRASALLPLNDDEVHLIARQPSKDFKEALSADRKRVRHKLVLLQEPEGMPPKWTDVTFREQDWSLLR